MAGTLTRGAQVNGEALVKSVARRIAQDSPKLADLEPVELEKLARVVVAESLKDDLHREADLARIDYLTERDRFLQRASRTGSRHTLRSYRAALEHLEAWCAAAAQRLSPLELTPALADDFIESEKASGASPATVQLRVAAASSFWTWLERRHEEIRNPFRGTRSRPAKKARRTLAVPSDAEVRLLEAEAEPTLAAAIVLMGQGGLRVGALPAMSITGARWSSTTKGKEQSGKVPEEAREAITRAGLPLRSPFTGFSAAAIADRFRRLAIKLHEAGKLQARYSVHDLRHAFAVRLYVATHDVYQVEKALGHATVAVTETYLRSLGLVGV
jgi:site-specific recombinase XerC